MKRYSYRPYNPSLKHMLLLAPLFLYAQSPALRAETAQPPFNLQVGVETPRTDHPIEMYDHGVMYINGDGVAPDAATGRYWITRAARLGYPLAQYSLGVIFQEGISGEPNSECARQWFMVAAEAEGEIGDRAHQAILILGAEALQNTQPRPKVYRSLKVEDCGWLPEIDSVVENPLLVGSTVIDIPGPGEGSGDTYGELLAHRAEPVIVGEPASYDDTISGIAPVLPDSSVGISIDNHNELSPKMSVVIPEPKVDTPPATLALPAGEKTSAASKTVTAPVYNLGGKIQTAPRSHYTLQLSSDRQPNGLYQIAHRHHLTNYQVYETQRHGQRWYVLVYGQYKTVDDAKQAIRSMPRGLQAKGPWVRRLSQVQQELQGIPAY